MVTQENKPEHNIYLKRVGFANLVYPITFKRNGKDVFIANANRFSIGSDRITSKSAGIKIFEKAQMYLSMFNLYRKKIRL